MARTFNAKSETIYIARHAHYEETVFPGYAATSSPKIFAEMNHSGYDNNNSDEKAEEGLGMILTSDSDSICEDQISSELMDTNGNETSLEVEMSVENDILDK